MVPKWAIPLRKRFQEVQLGFTELEVRLSAITSFRIEPLTCTFLQRYMHEMVAARRTAEKKEERYDLLSSLLDANEDTSKGGITDQELLCTLHELYPPNMD